MGSRQLGSPLYAQMSGRAGNQRPREAESNHGSQNLVAVAEESVSSVGSVVAAQVCPAYTKRPANKAQQPHTGIQHLEHCLAESHTGSEPCFLGNKRWWNRPLLARFLAAAQAARHAGGIIGAQKSSAPGNPSKSQGSLGSPRHAATLAPLENLSSGARRSRHS